MPLEADRRWSLTRATLDVLLRRLGDTPDEGEREYAALRRKLNLFFETRGLSSADALADEVIDRVARRLEEGVRVESVRGYFFGVAKLVAFEAERQERRERVALARGSFALPTHTPEEKERRSVCLDACLGALPEESRRLIVGYYQDGGDGAGRKLLADRLGVSYSNLKTRAHRIRKQLKDCLDECLERNR